MWLAIPDRVEWEGMSGFKYHDSHRAEINSDIHFTSFLADAGEHFVPTIDVLKNRKRIYLVSHETDAVVANWPVYRCIYCEIDANNEIFLLNNGKWYRVRSDFLGVVNHSFDEVMNGTLTLPNYSHEDEEAYNRSVAETAPDDFN